MKLRSNLKSILVLCEGNHCRSPIAEGLLREFLSPDFIVESAGFSALEGVSAHPEVLHLMAERGIDISSHRGRSLTPSMALRADLILVMDDPQRRLCGRLVPAVHGRVFLLGHWLPGPSRNIPDPFLKNSEDFRLVVETIQLSVVSWVPHMLSGKRLV